MSDTKWTPGPWMVQTMKNGIEHEILHGEYYVAATFGGCPGEERAGSNADLIAAAPELYSVLETAVIQGERILNGEPPAEGEDFDGWFLAAKAALAKARGEQP